MRRNGRGSVAVIVAVGALALAMSGILYAHWTDTLSAFAGVQTGTLALEWGAPGTDDDGIVGNDEAEIPDDDGVSWPQVYDRYFENSSSDPAAPNSADRYDKDVAVCFAEYNADADQLLWHAFNAYPSYHCSLYTTVTNTETIPVKASFFNLAVRSCPADDNINCGENPGDYVTPVPLAEGKIGIPNPTWDGVDPAFEYELILDIAEGIRCGTQIDPAETAPVTAWFHVEQGADQLHNYSINVEQEFMNWNEWTPEFCSPGAIVANPDGSIPTTP